MKLAKALKLKNQLAGEVAQLKELLAKQNVRSSKQKFADNGFMLMPMPNRQNAPDNLLKLHVSSRKAQAS